MTWKDRAGRKPLIIQGARQVGKTWLMIEFGRRAFKSTVYLNFDSNRRIHEIFQPDLDTARIIAGMEIEFHTKIDAETTLIIFDEIQECNRALVSLKYFCENAPQYHIAAAGSFLGVAMHPGSSFPVGKVNLLTLYPLSFAEFLAAIGEESYARALASCDFPMIAGMAGKMIEFLKKYFFIGGMPEAVLSYASHGDYDAVREIQLVIAANYNADFSKHINPSDIPKARLIWESVPAQLARENKKFLYKDVKSGARSREYENALNWLVNSGLVYQVCRVNFPGLPLASYRERDHFKLYMLDLGLLSAKSGLDIRTLLGSDTSLFTHFKGALAEQYVFQELKVFDNAMPLYYWANSKNTNEIDFLIQRQDQVIPVEVKSGFNLKAKSLKTFIEIYKPPAAIGSSLALFKRTGNLFEIPLYLVGQFAGIIAR
ncbi:MAG: ATP-binding protein [Treponema sp.]|jgi:predicted AAA+ superfamily ATPase|nr:ATP-binding protein [Treponema sp.]